MKPLPRVPKALPLKVLYTTSELARSIGVSRHVLFKLVRMQGIFVYRVGAQTLVPLGEIKDKLVPVWEAICLAEQNRKRDDSSENGARTSNAGGSAPHR